MSDPRISISDLRSIGRRNPDTLGAVALALIAAAEDLERAHANDCGCTRPGTEVCGWPVASGTLLAAFVFDEETEQWP